MIIYHQLSLGLERPVLLGHSMGGWLAQIYAALFPDKVNHNDDGDVDVDDGDDDDEGDIYVDGACMYVQRSVLLPFQTKS